MLTGIHVLLSYQCTFECDHCFVYSSPYAEGTFTLNQIRQVFDQADALGTVKSFYFEGGEAFIFYPLLMASIRMARERGYSAGIVTNSFFAATEEDAELWLEPLVELGISDLSLSDDAFHYADDAANFARNAYKAAQRLGLPTGTIALEEPTVRRDEEGKGEPIVGGGVVFRGRAVDKLVGDLPRKPWDSFTECPFETLDGAGRIHLDAYGHVHLCQGVSMGNIWKTPLPELVPAFDPQANPITGPLLRGGPAQLVREHGVTHEDGYVDACHMCYKARLALLERYPEWLAPPQVYGLA